jgi:hypothetical protein
MEQQQKKDSYVLENKPLLKKILSVGHYDTGKYRYVVKGSTIMRLPLSEVHSEKPEWVSIAVVDGKTMATLYEIEIV